jgi:hypothetical protein
MEKVIGLGLCLTLSLVLVFGSVLLFPNFINVALAVDMPDAPAIQDTVIAGKDGTDDNEGDEENDQPDDLPDPEDAPVTSETITPGENEGPKEDKDNEENGDEADTPNVLNDNNVAALPIQSCPNNQERALFTNACVPIQPCGNDIAVAGEDTPILSNPNDGCVNAPVTDHPSTRD